MIDRDTIVAPATPSGEGGIGIVRLSGPSAEKSLFQFFHPSSRSSSLTSHHLVHGRFLDHEGVLVDEVMAVVMRAPRSYTREDVVEVHCHGGPLVMRRILDLFLEAGPRLARPGEFTLRAFLNGRIDLARAEAVIDVIRSRSDAACQVALQQMDGRISTTITRFRDEVADLLAEVETHVDFSDEDIEHADQTSLQARALNLMERMDHLLGTFDSGRILREGLSVLLLGRPNAGKSSLMNALLGESRAIVTEIPGTTRDIIEESLNIGSLPLRLIDTAGIRHTDDLVEMEGMRRARHKVATSDLVLLVVDGSTPLDREDQLALDACGDARVLLVVNKSDLPPTPMISPFTDLPSVTVSSHTGEGMDRLRSAIENVFSFETSVEGRESPMLSDRRHREALFRARQALGLFYDGSTDNLSPEFLALDLRDALRFLGEITGETTPDDILDRIFSRFCIGK